MNKTQSFLNFDGCSPFFISSAISSVWFGEKNRNIQLETAKEKMAFQEHINKIKQQFEDKKFEQELRFKREMLEMGRFYQKLEAKRSFESEKKRLEFKYFKTYWPLETDIQAVWNEKIFSQNNAMLTVILARYNSIKANDDYSNTCDDLEKHKEDLHNIDVKHGAWKFSLTENVNYNIGGVAQNMNVHYIMQGIPTLIITPQIIGETLCFDASIWSFGHGLGSFFNKSMFSMPYEEKNYGELKEKIRFVQLAITGIVRDNFMMIEFNSPATLPLVINKEKLVKFPDIQQLLLKQYTELQNQIISNPEYKSLCSNKEIDDMQNSMNKSIKALSI